jgi:hypothetical protein
MTKWIIRGREVEVDDETGDYIDGNVQADEAETLRQEKRGIPIELWPSIRVKAKIKGYDCLWHFDKDKTLAEMYEFVNARRRAAGQRLTAEVTLTVSDLCFYQPVEPVETGATPITEEDIPF